MRQGDHNEASDDQAEILTYLQTPSTFGHAVGDVHVRETHGAYVVLAGDYAYKLKRAVAFSYMDFSTLEKRRAALLSELAINSRFAPDLYLEVLAVVRRADGGFALGGAGVPVEWVLRMRRFDESLLFSALAKAGRLDDATLKALADTIVASHTASPVHRGNGAFSRSGQISRRLLSGLRQCGLGSVAHVLDDLDGRLESAAARSEVIIEQRGKEGFVRRCHGDLHLRNIVMWEGRPTLFDALEFDEGLATVDTLYDLAFLLMDLDHVGHRRGANLVLNRYLWRHDQRCDLKGLAALPLFLAQRCLVRALVTAQHARQAHHSGGAFGVEAELGEARSYLLRAHQLLVPMPARLIAVGGFSGTGKSTLAAALAPDLAVAPGALHLRSDLERKAMFDAEETTRLPAESYGLQASADVYARLFDKARVALMAGQTTVIDAVFANAEERAEVETLAHRCGVAFTGLWLDAPMAVARQRVALRHGDASDADVGVVDRQFSTGTGSTEWNTIAAGGAPEQTLDAARDIMAGATS